MKRLLLIGCLVMAGHSAWADVGATVFSQGRTRFSVQGGYGTLNHNDYLILGAGAGYYVMNGLEAGVDGDAWLGSKPHIYEVSPRLTYVLYEGFSIKPYIGTFYKRAFFDTRKDRNSAGARAGIVSPLNEHTYLSAGLAYEGILNCDRDLEDGCSQVYPEIGLSFAF